jgi:hypothetical protein
VILPQIQDMSDAACCFAVGMLQIGHEGICRAVAKTVSDLARRQAQAGSRGFRFVHLDPKFGVCTSIFVNESWVQFHPFVEVSVSSGSALQSNRKLGHHPRVCAVVLTARFNYIGGICIIHKIHKAAPSV